MINLFRFLYLWKVVKQLADDLYRVLIKQNLDGTWYLESEAWYQIVDGFKDCESGKEFYNAICNMVYVMTKQQDKIYLINRHDIVVGELTWNDNKNRYV